MNILFYLIPKKDVVFLYNTYSVRQALEKMEFHHYSIIPILNKDGFYVGSISEGDLLWYIKNNNFNIQDLEKITIDNVPHNKELKPIKINAGIKELGLLIINQNFVPVVDDRNFFIGIVTRKAIISELLKKSGEGD